jgi:hypothetical protein
MVKLKGMKTMVYFCVFCLLLSPTAAFSYGYGGVASEDPVLIAFKNSISAVKANDWGKVEKIINDVSHTIESMDTFFGYNLLPELKKAIGNKDFKQVVKLLANLIYLSMMEKFEIMVQKELKDKEYTKSKLEICEIYYTGVLRGNVKSYDKKKGTTLADDILKAFERLEKLQDDPANLSKFKDTTESIKNNLNKAFDYFVFKR